MAEAELAALVDALPERPFHAPAWVEEVFRERWSDYRATEQRQVDAPAPVRAWSVGWVLGIETLVQSRPVVRGTTLSFLEDFLRPTASCTLATYTAAREASRPGEASVSRFQRWIGACSQRHLLDEEKARSVGLRASLRDSVPNFMQRSFVQNHDDELLFFAFLARLHAAGGLGSAFAPATSIRAALSQLSQDIENVLGGSYYLNMMVHDGRHFAMLHRGGTLTLWEAPPRPPPKHRTGPLPAAGIPRGSALFVLARNGQRDSSADPIPDGIFSVHPGNPTRLER